MRHPRRQRRRSVAPLLARLAEGVGLARERYARGRVGRERRTWLPSRASVSNGSSVHESGSGPAAGSVRPAEVGPARRAAALAALRAAPRAGAAGGGLDIGPARLHSRPADASPGCLRRLSARPGRLPRSRPPEDGLDPLTACGSQTALVRRQGHPHALALGARNRIRAPPGDHPHVRLRRYFASVAAIPLLASLALALYGELRSISAFVERRTTLRRIDSLGRTHA